MQDYHQNRNSLIGTGSRTALSPREMYKAIHYSKILKIFCTQGSSNQPELASYLCISSETMCDNDDTKLSI